MTFDKKAYQKEYMKKRRAKKRPENFPVPVLAEPEVNKEPPKPPISCRGGEARESTIHQAKTDCEQVASRPRGGEKPSKRGQDVDILPGSAEGRDPKLWAEAELRAERAREYAKKMPEFIRKGEEVFATPEWQYEGLERYS